MLTKEEIKRYNRHLILPEIGTKGQEKLKKAKVLVVGAGGLGCPVLQYLTAAGVGTIGICDFDFVDESNLQRQILFGTKDVGKSKAKVAAQKLSALNPFIKFIVHNVLLNKENAIAIIAKYDIIVDGSDNFPTRFLINDACVITKKPLVFGAIFKFEGQVTVFNYNHGPTYRCLFPEEPKDSEILSCSQIGVIGVLPGIVGSYQANEVIKIITGVGEVLSGKLLLIDALKMTHSLIFIKRNDVSLNINKLGSYGKFCMNDFSSVKQISSLELFEKLKTDKLNIIDIREKELYKDYNIDGQNISVEQILNNPDLISKDKDVIIVCEKGINSASVINELQNNYQFNNLYNLKGGIQDWIENDLPINSKRK